MDQLNNPFTTSMTRRETVKLTLGKCFSVLGPSDRTITWSVRGQPVVSGLCCSVIMGFQSPECVCLWQREKDREKEWEPNSLHVYTCLMCAYQCRMWMCSIRSLIKAFDWLKCNHGCLWRLKDQTEMHILCTLYLIKTSYTWKNYNYNLLCLTYW